MTFVLIILSAQIKDTQKDMMKKIVHIERALHPGIDMTKLWKNKGGNYDPEGEYPEKCPKK